RVWSVEPRGTPPPPGAPPPEKTLHELLAPTANPAVVVPHQAPIPTATPVVHFARPARPLGSGIDLGSRFASSGAGMGGLGIGGGGGGAGWSLGTSFGRYVGGLRQVGLHVAVLVDAPGSMQNLIHAPPHPLPRP